MMIEPTETESKPSSTCSWTLSFSIGPEVEDNPELVLKAPTIRRTSRVMSHRGTQACRALEAQEYGE